MKNFNFKDNHFFLSDDKNYLLKTINESKWIKKYIIESIDKNYVKDEYKLKNSGIYFLAF